MGDEQTVVSKDVGTAMGCLQIRVDTRLQLSDEYRQEIGKLLQTEGVEIPTVAMDKLMEKMQALARGAFIKGRDMGKKIEELTG